MFRDFNAFGGIPFAPYDHSKKDKDATEDGEGGGNEGKDAELWQRIKMNVKRLRREP